MDSSTTVYVYRRLWFYRFRECYNQLKCDQITNEGAVMNFSWPALITFISVYRLYSFVSLLTITGKRTSNVVIVTIIIIIIIIKLGLLH